MKNEWADSYWINLYTEQLLKMGPRSGPIFSSQAEADSWMPLSEYIEMRRKIKAAISEGKDNDPK